MHEELALDDLELVVFLLLIGGHSGSVLSQEV